MPKAFSILRCRNNQSHNSKKWCLQAMLKDQIGARIQCIVDKVIRSSGVWLNHWNLFPVNPNSLICWLPRHGKRMHSIHLKNCSYAWTTNNVVYVIRVLENMRYSINQSCNYAKPDLHRKILLTSSSSPMVERMSILSSLKSFQERSKPPESSLIRWKQS